MGNLLILGWLPLWRILDNWFYRLFYKGKRAGKKKVTGEGQAFVVAWAVTLYGYIAFTIGIGSLNDHFFYFLMIPVTFLNAYSLNLSFPRLINPALPLWLKPKKKLALAGLLGVGLALVLGYNLYTWIRIFGVGQDNSLFQMKQYLEQHLQPGTMINSPFSKHEKIFRDIVPNYDIVSFENLGELQQFKVHYVIISSKQVWGKYTFMNEECLNWVKQNGRKIFSVYGNTFWEMTLYYIDSPNRYGPFKPNNDYVVAPLYFQFTPEGRWLAETSFMTKPTESSNVSGPPSGVSLIAFHLGEAELMFLLLIIINLFQIKVLILARR
jgi:hypothetical protein